MADPALLRSTGCFESSRLQVGPAYLPMAVTVDGYTRLQRSLLRT